MKTEGKLAVVIGVVLAGVVAAFFLIRGQSAGTVADLAGGGSKTRVAESSPSNSRKVVADSATISGDVEPVTPPVTPLVPAESDGVTPPTTIQSTTLTTQEMVPTTQPSLTDTGLQTTTPLTPPTTPPSAPAGPSAGGSGRQVDWNALLAGASVTPPTGSGVGPRVGGEPSGSRLAPVTPPAGPTGGLTGGLTGLGGSGLGTTYTVKAGDSFSKISATAYGSPNYWAKIAAANPNVNSSKLRVGQVLAMPPESEVKGSAGAAVPARTEGVSGSVLVKDPTREYRVVSGDSLHKISQRLYGSASRWEEIYELNKDVIGSSPTKLKLGMVLRLPSPPTATTRP